NLTVFCIQGLMALMQYSFIMYIFNLSKNIPMNILSTLTRAAGFFVAFCFINTLAFAATNVSGGMLASAHWTLSGSPYKIMGNVIVADNDTLVIDPGVVVEFQGKYKLFC